MTTMTKGNITISDIKIGDIQYEYEYDICVKSEVITLPIKNEYGFWTWKNKIISTGNIINYMVKDVDCSYGPKLYNYEAYKCNKII